MQKLFIKPDNMRYVDLAVWVDENIYQEDCDYTLAFSYVYLITEMLVKKKRYFKDIRDVEEFSSIVACSVFQRLTNYSNSPIKSVLNYIKSILNVRRIGYEAQRHQEIIDPEIIEEWDSQLYYDNLRASLESHNRHRIEDEIKYIISSVNEVIKESIPKVYRSNKLLFRSIYKSSLLTLLNRFTLPNYFDNRMDIRLLSPDFNEVNFLRKHLDDSIILWHLDKEYESVVIVTVNKTIRYLTTEIKDLIDNSKISDDELSYIATSAIFTGGNNETNY